MEFDAALGRYVIMPDHVHFFILGQGTKARDLASISG